MTSRLLILFTLLSYVSFGQTIAPYNEKDFPLDKFIIKKERNTLGTITVDVIQVKPIKQGDSKQFACRTWLTISEKEKIIKELTQDMEGVGGCYGFYFPDKQPNKNLIVISKFGDYDGRLLIVNNKGELKDYLGGKFYVSADNKYIFSNYDSDLSGTSVIDLIKNELIYSGELKQYLAAWYYQDGQYYAIISDDVIVNGETGHLVFDFVTKEFKELRTKDSVDISRRLRVYNDPMTLTNCHCGK